ncbi:hypothetical protein COO91_08354 [Nostoc flagelliforme CCNUN1]|uniref:Uncharacterized protein n=1 Tax=Nostoc flagelliforme CCNUN1 TaxID=2038116 RepID=A0A2K8T3G1_9NOSO|nr:hypothetical protein COO91_08354 [Nostoc flagelliforme CCNUN1]
MILTLSVDGANGIAKLIVPLPPPQSPTVPLWLYKILKALLNRF